MSASPEKNCEIGMLLDLYGALLTERQRDVCELYYDDDLSLSEVADECGISRQGVRDALLKSEAQLLRCEDALGLLSRRREDEKTAKEIYSLLSRAEQNGKAEKDGVRIGREDLRKLNDLLAGLLSR